MKSQKLGNVRPFDFFCVKYLRDIGKLGLNLTDFVVSKVFYE